MGNTWGGGYRPANRWCVTVLCALHGWCAGTALSQWWCAGVRWRKSHSAQSAAPCDAQTHTRRRVSRWQAALHNHLAHAPTARASLYLDLQTKYKKHASVVKHCGALKPFWSAQGHDRGRARSVHISPPCVFVARGAVCGCARLWRGRCVLRLRRARGHRNRNSSSSSSNSSNPRRLDRCWPPTVWPAAPPPPPPMAGVLAWRARLVWGIRA